ncbi:hypothetical protein I317_02484 [Kwoniella heveanensis CBS 569]|nr:hypothetical protein I317_02484 [Kwoniella heveanensis CBS 569]
MVPGQSPSPDPLASNYGKNDNELADCIVVSSTSPKYAVGPSTPSKTPRKRVQPVVEIPTPRKKKTNNADGSITTPKKTPANAAKGVHTPSRASPTPNGKGKSGPMKAGETGEAVTPIKRPRVSLNTPKGSAKATPKLKGTPTLASSLNKPLPTPSPAQSSRKRPRIASPVKSVAKALTFDDEIFESPSHPDQVDISRQTFLANEALKRQREARNFVYEGEASAPKLTRSGRMIGKEDSTMRESEELDEYGGRPEEDNPLGPQASIVPDVDVKSLGIDTTPIPSTTKTVNEETRWILPEPAKPYLRRILANLTSQNVATHSPPFDKEEANEPLTGVVNLLKGTVERGEGNSALVVGPRGVGKTRTIARALNLLPSASKTSPIVVRLSGHAQTNDRLAIREMGRQIAEAEGQKIQESEETEEEGVDGEEYAPTTLPSHLLALLTAPSPRAIIIIIEEFDFFTEHARQALLYCLLDVVQSVKTGPVETTGRGVAVIGVTTRVDTLLLLEKRVKSRFSHRTWRIPSPLSPDGMGWNSLLRSVLSPADCPDAGHDDRSREAKMMQRWKEDWDFAVQMLLDDSRVKRRLERMAGLTTDVRTLFRPFILPVASVLAEQVDFLSIPDLAESVLAQIEGAGWGLQNTKIKGLPHPALGVLIIAKHLSYAGREEFNFSQVEEEYLRFARTKLVGSGKVRWPIGVLKMAFDHLVRLSLLIPTSSTNMKPNFIRVRSTLSPHEVVAYFKGPGANLLGPELGNWGRMMGGHA